MKKFFISVLLCVALALPLGLTACGGNDEQSVPPYTYETAYATAASLGYSGTLEEFIELISGKDGKDGVNGTNGKDGKDGINGTNGKDGVDGVGIKSVEFNAEGELVITGTNGEVLFQGKPPACEHDFSYDLIVTLTEPTCTSMGVKQAKCSKCGNFKYITVAAKRHKFEKQIKLSHPANCQEKGDCLFVCNVCQTTVASEFYGEHIYESGVCTLCGAEKGSDGLAFTLNEDLKSYSVSGLGDCAETDIIIPQDYLGLPVTKIARSAFLRAQITSVKIPENITEIGQIAFSQCKNLSKIDISYGVKKIEGGAFVWCAIEDITIPDSVTELGNVFYRCDNLKSIKLSKNLTAIKGGTFYFCQSLTEVILPDNITKISSLGFYHCHNLKSVVLGKNLTHISEGAFNYCPALESVFFGGNERQWADLNKPYKIVLNENTTVYYYSETAPEVEGNFWRFVNGKPEIWN